MAIDAPAQRKIAISDVHAAFTQAMDLRTKGTKASVVVSDRRGFSIVVNYYRITPKKEIWVRTKGGFYIKNPIKIFVREGSSEQRHPV